MRVKGLYRTYTFILVIYSQRELLSIDQKTISFGKGTSLNDLVIIRNSLGKILLKENIGKSKRVTFKQLGKAIYILSIYKNKEQRFSTILGVQ